MNRLWAPWRLSYVATTAPRPDNFITFADQSDHDRENLVVCRSERAIVILNRYPYSNGHLLVAPRREVAEIDELDDAELLDCQRQIQRMVRAIRGFMRPDGFNVGLNLGRPAGAGLPQPLHWHVVPRWSGDTNFMTVLDDVRIIVQSLDELWLRLRRELGMET